MMRKLARWVTLAVMVGATVATGGRAAADVNAAGSVTIGSQTTYAYVGPTWVAWHFFVNAGEPIVQVVTSAAGAQCQPTYSAILDSSRHDRLVLEGGICTPQLDAGNAAIGLYPVASSAGMQLSSGQDYYALALVTAGPTSTGTAQLQVTTDGNSPVTPSNDASADITVLGFSHGAGVTVLQDKDFAAQTGGTFTSVPGYTVAHIHGSIPLQAQHFFVGMFNSQRALTSADVTLTYTNPQGVSQTSPYGIFVGGNPVGADGPGNYQFRLDEDYTSSTEEATQMDLQGGVVLVVGDITLP